MALQILYSIVVEREMRRKTDANSSYHFFLHNVQDMTNLLISKLYDEEINVRYQ